MAPPTLSFVHNSFLSLTEVALGRLVLDTKNPGQDFWPRSTFSVPANHISKRTVTNIYQQLEEETHSTLRIKLTHFFSAKGTRHRMSIKELVAPLAAVYTLTQPTAHFKSLCDDETTAIWIKANQRRGQVFLVVGLITVTDAKVAQSLEISMNGGIEADVPVTNAVSSGTAEVLAGEAHIFDVGIMTSGDRNGSSIFSFLAPGERVIGVQYRKIRPQLFRRGADWISLGKPHRWVTFNETAGEDSDGDLDLCGPVNDLTLDDEIYSTRVVSGECLLID
jgi:hypothetical protein